MPATDDTKPNRNTPKPGHRHLNIPNVPEPDLIALEHAATDARQTRAELVRALLHTAAEQQRGQGKAGPVAAEQPSARIAALEKALREVADTVHYMEGSPALDLAVKEIIDEALGE